MADWHLCDGTGRLVVPNVERALGLSQRGIGLLGRASLCDTCGLWLEPCNGVHTWGMRFAIDVVYFDKSGRVLRLYSNVEPRRICFPMRHTRAVLELPSGAIVRLGLGVGGCYQLKRTSIGEHTEDV